MDITGAPYNRLRINKSSNGSKLPKIYTKDILTQ